MKYDGILLGSGHNSLVLQATLARAGLKTLCLEKNAEIGGGLTTVEDPTEPGFFHNTHSFFHRAITSMPWFKDLQLEKYGVKYLEPELSTSLLLENGETLNWWRDFDKTYESFASFSRKDADTLRRWRDEFIPVVENITGPEAARPPLPPEERQRILERSPEGRRLLETSRLSPLEFVEREFENTTIKAGLLFFNGLREVDLRCRGFGHHIPMLLASRGKTQMCVGGSRALAAGLAKVIEENGGEIRTEESPVRILTEGGRVTGVQTSKGATFHAERFIASGLNPHQTFLGLLDDKTVPRAWKEKAKAFKYNLIAPLFSLNLNLNEEPAYLAAENNPDVQNAHMIILGLEHFETYPEIVRAHQEGKIPPTVMWGACPTHFDPSQAPAGKHTAFMWEKLPYKLGGDPLNWDRERDQHGEAMLKKWQKYAPNLKQAVRSSFCRSPLDTERSFENMKEGDLLVGTFTNGQIGYDRPFRGAGHYRTHLEGLYLCGSSSHPGGNITGLPGHNCAQVLLEDLGVEAGQ